MQADEKTSEQKQEYKRAWREYCQLENLSSQRPLIDKMRCTNCGVEHPAMHLSDAGWCDTCVNLL